MEEPQQKNPLELEGFRYFIDPSHVFMVGVPQKTVEWVGMKTFEKEFITDSVPRMPVITKHDFTASYPLWVFEAVVKLLKQLGVSGKNLSKGKYPRIKFHLNSSKDYPVLFEVTIFEEGTVLNVLCSPITEHGGEE